MSISIRLAENDQDVDNARDLCLEWLDWHWTHYPKDWPRQGNPMNPTRFKAVLQDLPTIHARPKGAILLAFLDDRPVGCVMYCEQSEGVAEFNRMFVSDAGRGHGIGRRLLDYMFMQMASDGYRSVMFSSANFLTHAKAMYEASGFVSVPHPDEFPSDWVPYTYVMRRSLVP